MVRSFRAGDPRSAAGRPQAGGSAPAATPPSGGERPVSARPQPPGSSVWPSSSARPRRAGRPERILRLVQPGETLPPQYPAPPGHTPQPGRVAQPARTAPPVRTGRPVGQPGRAQRVVQPGPARQAPPRVRLTRRGRLVVWALATMLVAAVLTPVLLAVTTGAQAANHGAPAAAVRASMQHIVVQPGQSLWSIAQQVQPRADPRVVIQQIIQDNALGSDVVIPGESLWVPGG
jgi:LysM domain-containing protein